MKTGDIRFMISILEGISELPSLNERRVATGSWISTFVKEISYQYCANKRDLERASFVQAHEIRRLKEEAIMREFSSHLKVYKEKFFKIDEHNTPIGEYKTYSLLVLSVPEDLRVKS